MFIGHHAAGFASKRLAPETSLAALMLAPLLLDLLWPVFVLAGIEHARIDPGNTALTPLDFVHYPWSHSLLMAVVWGVVAGALYWLFTRRVRGALVIATGVVSHWVFDLIVHRPDLPLYPGGPKVGLGLWNSVPGTLVVEGAIFAAGLYVYMASTRARDRVGKIALWSLVVFLIIIYAGNVFGPPPPNMTVVAVAALAMLLFVLWGWWIDRHHVVRA